jgi:hypothetical protein
MQSLNTAACPLEFVEDREVPCPPSDRHEWHEPCNTNLYLMSQGSSEIPGQYGGFFCVFIFGSCEEKRFTRTMLQEGEQSGPAEFSLSY